MSILKVVSDTLTVARYRLLVQVRARTWFVTASTTSFFLVGPLVLLGETLVGKGGERLGPFAELSGYDNYTGYLAIPLVFAVLTNSAYSWIGQAIRSEQVSGTFERVLVSMRFPSALMLGGSVAHIFFLGFYIAFGIVSIMLLADLDLNVNWPSALAAGLLHLYAVYGFAFVLTSLFLWIHDAFIVQQSISYFIIPIVAGAGFPIAILPGWMQAVSKAIPFTWAFELERATFLKHTSLDEMAFHVVVLLATATAMWLVAFALFRVTLRRALRTGNLGLY
jgi:ABC-2 type transport system permease protein